MRKTTGKATMSPTPDPLRVIGRRKTRPITFHASGALLAEGARFNDEIHKLPGGNVTCIPKGVYRFKTHEEANAHGLKCVADAIAQITKREL